MTKKCKNCIHYRKNGLCKKLSKGLAYFPKKNNSCDHFTNVEKLKID